MKRIGFLIIGTTLIVAFVGCGARTETQEGQNGQSDAEAIGQMFLRNRGKMKSPSERFASGFELGLSGFTTPMIGAQNRNITLDLTLRTKPGYPDLVVLDVIPYEVGASPPTRFVPLTLSNMIVPAGESRTISIEARRERPSAPQPVNPGVNPGAGQISPDSGGAPAPLASLPALVTSEGRSEAQASPGPPGPGDDSTPKSPFDPATGLQVLVVGGYADEVPAEGWKSVTLVSDAAFEARYGEFMARQVGIGVPIQQLA